MKLTTPIPGLGPQGMPDLTPARCTDIAQRYKGPNGFGVVSLVQYLHSNENSARDPESDKLHQV